jgi:hypothetical protein
MTDIAMTSVVCFQNANSVRLRSIGRSSPLTIVYGCSALACGCTCCRVEVVFIGVGEAHGGIELYRKIQQVQSREVHEPKITVNNHAPNHVTGCNECRDPSGRMMDDESIKQTVAAAVEGPDSRHL